MIRTCLTVIAALAAVGTACAAEFHVAQGVTPGSNDPVLANAHPTISAALQQVKPGDTVIVHEGTYREEAEWPGDDWNDPTIRCTLAAAPGEQVIMTGSEIVTGPWSKVELTLATPPTTTAAIYVCPWEAPSQMVFVDGTRLQQIGLLGSPERDKGTNGFQWQKAYRGKTVADLRPGSFFCDGEAQQLYVWLADGSNPADHLIEASVRQCALVLNGTWTVSGLDIQHYQDGYWPREQAVAISGNRVIVENCRVMHNEFVGLIVSGQDGMIRDNEIAYNGLMGFTSCYGHRMVFQGNRLHHNAWHGDVKCGTSGNKWVAWRDSAFLGNHFHDEPASALWLDISDANILIAENLFEDCDVGVYFEISRYAIVVNNVFRRCCRGVWVYSSDTLVAHNIIDSCGEGITVSSYPRVTAMVPEKGSPGRPDALMAVRNNLIVNNILVDCPGAYVGIMEPDAYGWGNASDYNVIAWTLPAVHETGLHINFMSSWDQLYGKLPIWRVERHCDEHSTLADAALLAAVREGSPWVGVAESQIVDNIGFVDRAAGDYRLQPDSKLVGRGIRVPAELNAPYTPGSGHRLPSTLFGATAMSEKPSADTPSVYGGESGHYRLQPLPPTRPLIDLSSVGTGTPGLNAEWTQTGTYPTFVVGVEDTPAPDAYAVEPENLARDGSFDQPILAGGADIATNAWASDNGMHSAMGMACANLPAGAATTLSAVQRIGPARAGARYVLYCETRVDAGMSGQVAIAEARIVAGAAQRPVGDPIVVRGEPGKTMPWHAAAVEIPPAAIAAAAEQGEDLYVQLIGRTEEAGAAPPGGQAFVRFDQVVLLGSGK